MKKGGPKSLSNSRLVQTGFTIVETMIVLAVTGGMLLIAIAYVSGRQDKTEFQTAINNMHQHLEQLINETESGHYVNNSDFTCVGTGTLVTLTPPPGSGQTQGTNTGCIFLGNAIQFGTDSDASTLGIIPVVGKQYVGGAPVQQVDTAKPRAVLALGSETNPTGSVTTENLDYGLTVTTAGTAPGCTSGGMCYFAGATAKSAGAIAILAGDSTGQLASQAGVDLKPGAQQFTLYGVNNTSPNQASTLIAQRMGNYTDSSGTAVAQGLERASKAVICIASGTTSQSGLFTITSDLHVTLQIFGTNKCV